MIPQLDNRNKKSNLRKPIEEEVLLLVFNTDGTWR